MKFRTMAALFLALSVSNAQDAPPTEVKMNTKATAGSISCEVTRCFTTNKISDAGSGAATAGDDSTFVVFEIAITNEGKEPQQISGNSSRFAVIDGKSRTFSCNEEALYCLYMGRKDKKISVMGGVFQPGIRKVLSTVFEVPKSSINADLRLIIAPNGAGDGALVSLDKIEAR